MGVYVFRGDDEDDDDRRTHCCGNREKNICVEDWSSFPSQELCPLRMIIENDNADEFNSFLRKSKIVFQMDDVLLKYAGFQICPYGILGKICHHRASKCATLLLSRRRKLGSMMNLNILNCYRSYPLHDAAITLSPTLVKILLDRGASLDARSWDQAGISPLEYAVERFSCDTNLIEWSPKKSVFKLIIALCLPQMKEALETIDLLAGVSANSTVMFDTIFSAVKRGQVVSVAVLLLLARDRVMQSHFFATNISRSTYMPFPESIMNELSALMNQESALMGCKEHSKILQLCREKKELMMYFLQMIEIFNRAGTDLKSYLETRTSDVTNEQVSYHVAELLKEAGFILSTNDSDISDITSSPKLGQVPLDATVKQQEYEDDPEGIFFKPCREQLCRCDMKIPSCTTSNVFQRIVGPTLLHNHHRGFSSRAGPSIDQPLCTVPRRNICFLSRLPNVFGEVGPCDKSGDNVSLDLPAIDCDKTIMVTLKHDEKLQDGAECSFQCALLYTTVYGQRRIRVSTLSLPCTTMLSNLFRSADLDTQFACFLKQAANEIPSSPLLQIREQMTTLCINILHSYRKFCATVSSAGQLILPEALKLLPLYTLALIKSTGLRTDGRIDDRSYWINYVSSLSTPLAIPLVYPRMISIHDMDLKETDVILPPAIPLSSEHVTDDGIYLLVTGEDCLLYIGTSVDPEIVRQLLGISSVEEIPTQFVLQQYDNPLSKKLNEVVNEIRRQRCSYLRLKLCKKGDASAVAKVANPKSNTKLSINTILNQACYITYEPLISSC